MLGPDFDNSIRSDLRMEDIAADAGDRPVEGEIGSEVPVITNVPDVRDALGLDAGKCFGGKPRRGDHLIYKAIICEYSSSIRNML